MDYLEKIICMYIPFFKLSSQKFGFHFAMFADIIFNLSGYKELNISWFWCFYLLPFPLPSLIVRNSSREGEEVVPCRGKHPSFQRAQITQTVLYQSIDREKTHSSCSWGGESYRLCIVYSVKRGPWCCVGS